MPIDRSLPLPDGSTLLFATVGDPIGQAKAPAMMSAILAEQGINGIWLPIAADHTTLETVLAAVRHWRNFAGLSITIPHKAAALRHVDHITRRAEASGGINIVRRESDGTLLGDMVDGTGFVAGLSERNIAIRGRAARIVGAGGAGSALAAALCEAGIAVLEIADRDRERVRVLQQRLARFFPQARVCEAAALTAVDLAINASPAGLQAADPLPFDPATLAPGTLVCDIIMSPPRTRLLARAEELGYPTQPGLPMLAHQAALYLDFFGYGEATRHS